LAVGVSERRCLRKMMPLCSGRRRTGAIIRKRRVIDVRHGVIERKAGPVISYIAVRGVDQSLRQATL
jgi:hypothetical protein